MVKALIRGSLHHRTVVVVAALLLLAVGGAVVATLPVDVLPDFTAPTVTVLAEAPGLAAEEVDLTITYPITAALAGAPGIRRVRSASAAGLSVVWAEFHWGKDIYRARQMVAERLDTLSLPGGGPRLGSITSLLGEVMFLALTSESLPPQELRRLGEVAVRRPLMAVPGVAEILLIGGEEPQIQVAPDPAAMAQHRVRLDELAETLRQASAIPAPGVWVTGGQEYQVRASARARSAQDVAGVILRTEQGTPITVERVAKVREGVAPRLGAGGYNGRPAVVLSVYKQPGVNTLALTARIDRVLEELAATLPPQLVIERQSFRQADFIRVAIRNVSVALRDGALVVILVLLLFLGNLRATAISATAIPLSLVAAVLVLAAFGISINTMTLGGLTIAIGALVDDAIIDVENVVRRLRGERQRPPGQRRPALQVVYQACLEVRGAIVFATAIIVLAFVPLLLLPGLEGRLLRPLGLACVAALTASLLVSLTVTPALSLGLLPGSRAEGGRPTPLVRLLEGWYRPTLAWALGHPRAVLTAAALAVTAAALAVPWLGRAFLPPFNEGSLTVTLVSPPGITLADADALGRQVEETLLAFPEVVSTTRRSGRAERDEHGQGVGGAEIEVVLRPGRPKEELLEAMREALSTLPGVAISFGQPISHRIDHLVSGSKAHLAIKVFGRDSSVLAALASTAAAVARETPGVVDVSGQEQSPVPQLVLDFDRQALAQHGLTPAQGALSAEALFFGAPVGQITSEGRSVPVVLRFPDTSPAELDSLLAFPLPVAGGRPVPLSELARVRVELGPALIRRENAERVAVVTANVAGTDMVEVAERLRRRLAAAVPLPAGYRIELGGQYEAAQEALRVIALLAAATVVIIYLFLYLVFRNHRAATIILVNLPLAAVGGVVGVLASGGVLSIGSLVGFITLFGVAVRNGVLLVGHYQHLRHAEGLDLPQAVLRGSLERMSPVLMTALTAALALLPLVVAGGEAGNEIQAPMAMVILTGLVSSTFLNLVLVPVLFSRWGEGRQGTSAP